MSSLMVINGTVNGDIRIFDNEQTGSHRASFTVQDYYKKTDRDSGEKSYVNLNYDVTLWGKDADRVAEYFKDGKAIVITGHFKGMREWTSKDGSKSGVNFVLDNCIMDFAAQDKAERGQTNGSNSRKRSEPAEELDLG